MRTALSLRGFPNIAFEKFQCLSDHRISVFIYLAMYLVSLTLLVITAILIFYKNGERGVGVGVSATVL